MENRSHALMAGIFVLLLGIAVAIAGWFLGGKRDLTNTYLLETRRSVTGLNVQAQVRYRGIRAGKVESIGLDPADPRIILVTVSLDRRYPLTSSAVAQLGFQGVTGLAFVNIEDDGSGASLAAAGAARPRLPLRPGLLDILGEKSGDMVVQFTEVAARLNRLLDEKNTRNLAQTLDNVAAASTALKQLPPILAAMRATLSDDNLKRLNGVLVQLERTAGEAAPLTAEMRELVKSMTVLSENVDRFVAAGAGEVTANTLPQFNALLEQLIDNSHQLGRVLDTLEERPQAFVFGPGKRRPGPGEAGFRAPALKEK